jgi:hypothetical protein
MRSLADVEIVLALFEAGLSNRRISILTGISRTTIRDWRRKGRQSRGARLREPDRDCPTCGNAVVPGSRYAYLLGLYLGDGCISAHPRGVYKLRVTMDLRYPSILQECGEAMRMVRPSSGMKVGFARKIGCLEVYAHWKHWPCLFPQHGPGRKHERKIELVPWQVEIADEHPGWLLRGLIHSDGYRGLNHVNGKGYPRYQFSNRSKDIRDIFCRACDVYGVRWRQNEPLDHLDRSGPRRGKAGFGGWTEVLRSEGVA